MQFALGIIIGFGLFWLIFGPVVSKALELERAIDSRMKARAVTENRQVRAFEIIKRNCVELHQDLKPVELLPAKGERSAAGVGSNDPAA